MKNSTVVIATLSVLALVFVGYKQFSNDHFSAADKAYREGDYEKAIRLFTLAANESDDLAIYANRANCYSYVGDLDAALKDYKTAIEKAIKVSKDANDPRLASLYYNRGYAYQRAKRYEQAIPDYEKTILLDDEYPDVKNNLAWILATCPHETLRDPRRAVTIATIECKQKDWKDASLLDTLAAAHASAGNFPKAIERLRQAIEIAEDAEIEQEYQTRLALYLKNKSFIEPIAKD